MNPVPSHSDSGVAWLESLLHEICVWAVQRPDVQAVALVGSWARGQARADSDVDLVMLCEQPEAYRLNAVWPEQLFPGRVRAWIDADYGAVWSRHLTLKDGLEVELGCGQLQWASLTPVDPGTAEVLAGGFRILFDPHLLLQKLERQLG